MVYTDVQTNIRLSIYEDSGKKSYSIAIGDSLTNLKYNTSRGVQTIAEGTVTSFDVYTKPEGTRGSETRVDGVSYSNKLRDDSQSTASFNEVFTIRGLVVNDGTELHNVGVNDIVSVDTVTPSVIVVYPGADNPIKDAIAKVTGKTTGIYLTSGVYEEEVTINKPLKMFGCGNGNVILTKKVKVELTNVNQVVEINDVTVKGTLSANEGLVALSSKGTLVMNGVCIYGTGAGAADKSSLVSKAKADNTSNACIIMNHCSLTVGDGDHTKDVVAIRVGNATDPDKGATRLFVHDSTITAKNDAVQFFSRKKSEVVFKNCEIEGMTVFHMGRNGENDNMGQFDVQFVDGSHVVFENCNLKSFNPYAANPSADAETNQSGLIELDHSKLACVKVLNSFMAVEHGVTAESVSGKFAPAYAAYAGKDSACKDCAIYMENVSISMVEPTDAVACKLIPEGNRVESLGTKVFAHDEAYQIVNVSLV